MGSVNALTPLSEVCVIGLSPGPYRDDGTNLSVKETTDNTKANIKCLRNESENVRIILLFLSFVSQTYITSV